MNQVVKFIGVIVVTFIILGLPVLTCLSFVFDWHIFFQLVLITSVAIEMIFIFGEVYERSEDE